MKLLEYNYQNSHTWMMLGVIPYLVLQAPACFSLLIKCACDITWQKMDLVIGALQRALLYWKCSFLFLNKILHFLCSACRLQILQFSNLQLWAKISICDMADREWWGNHMRQWYFVLWLPAGEAQLMSLRMKETFDYLLAFGGINEQ